MSRRSILQLLVAQPLAVGSLRAQTRFHQAPKPLSDEAVTHDWKSFLGPSSNAVSTETHLSRMLPPPLIWEFAKGDGYTSPAIAGDHLVFLHRVGDKELIECLHSETGEQRWQYQYPSTYRDRYGYNNGPRSSPVISENMVFTLGAEGMLNCLQLDSGEVVWTNNLRQVYGMRQDFFGMASTPLVSGKRLIVNVGVPDGPTVLALDTSTGLEIWRAGSEWGPSYASPIQAVIHGQPRLFVYAGGESRPPSGGLMSIKPETGDVDFSVPWRSRLYESVNASCPVVFDNKVFISASYRTGGALIEILPNFKPRILWTTSEFALHFNTPIYRDGYLYGFDGRNQGDASLACVDAETGKVVWREVPQWTESFELGGRQRQQVMGTARGSLLAADGQFLCLGELGHLIWMDLTPEGFTEVSRSWLMAARESWTLPVLSRGLLYVAQNTRDLLRGAGPRLLCYDLRA